MNNKPTKFFNIMPNGYFQSFRDNFSAVRSQEELDRLKEKCCKNCYFNKIGTCGLRPCKFENDYLLYREIIDAIRKPTTVYVEAPKRLSNTREYNIKPETQCIRTVTSIISKRIKINDENITSELLVIKENIEHKRFKRALHYAQKGNFDSIVKVINNYINKK